MLFVIPGLFHNRDFAERNLDGITEGAGKEVGVERRFFFSVADVEPFEGLDQREDGI